MPVPSRRRRAFISWLGRSMPSPASVRKRNFTKWKTACTNWKRNTRERVLSNRLRASPLRNTPSSSKNTMPLGTNSLPARSVSLGKPKSRRSSKTDQEQFQEIDETGRQYFHGPLVPDWLEDLVEAVAGCMEVDEPMGPLGYRWHEEDGDFWEIDLYPTPIELVGGAVDGAIVDPGYSLDLAALQSVFERIDALYWNTHGYHGSEPPFVSVEGIYEGREVFLRVLSAAPDGEEPGMKFQVTR